VNRPRPISGIFECALLFQHAAQFAGEVVQPGDALVVSILGLNEWLQVY